MKHSVEEITLKNGARGLFVDVPTATVMNYKIEFRAGNKFVSRPEIYETAHIMEHLAFGANAKFKDEQTYEDEFTKNGAYHNAWTSDYSICYEAECADFEWDRILDLQSLAVCQPKFNEEELKAEKGNVRAELTGYQNDYSRLIWPKLQQEMGENVLTYAERLKTIGDIDIKDIREHHRRTHRAQNMRFIIAGNLHGRKKQLTKMLEHWQLRPGERFEADFDNISTIDPVLIRRKDASNLTFGFTWTLRRKLEVAELMAMNCLNHILNGTMSSKILGKARRRGIIYGMGSAVGNGAWTSDWTFDGEVNEENASELFDLIAVELSKVINGDLDETTVLTAKSYALGRYQMGAQTVGQLSDYYSAYFMSGEIEPFDDMPSRIDAIGKAEIIALAREFMQAGASGLAAVGNLEKSFVAELWLRVISSI